MSFSSASGGISSAGDVALSNPTNTQLLGYDSATAKWKNISPSGSATPPGMVYFDTFFAGVDDNAKVAALNTWAQAQSNSTPAVLFGARQYNFSTPIKLFSGLKLVGGTMSTAREYSRGTVLNWQGGTDSSMFIFPPEGQTGQSYPADGSPRDISVSYIQMQGGASTHCIENFDIGSDTYVGHTLWYCQFHACGFKNFKTVWWGWGTGSSISGVTHFESIVTTALYLGGSENRIFGNDGYSFAGSSVDTLTPFMRTTMGKSYIGNCMVTARKVSTVLSIEGGHNLVVDSLAVDSQSSDPIYGAGIVISGGESITITNCSFKGVATTPASGWGGSSNNKGWIHIKGGDQILLQANGFRREGNNMPATSYPLVYVDAAVPDSAVRWGYNSYSSFGTSTVQLQQGATNKIIVQADPRVGVITAP